MQNNATFESALLWRYEVRLPSVSLADHTDIAPFHGFTASLLSGHSREMDL